ncbi:MAG: hypothetical protein K2J77_06775 [Oscillospiraceae bacterium]|nr:hypothetical protein [Oscillospiraceae bacterium]
MDEKIVVSKEQKRISLLLVIAIWALMITNVLLMIFSNKRYLVLVPISIVLCCAALVLTLITMISTIKGYKKLNNKMRVVFSVVGLFVLCGLEISMCVTAVSEIYSRRNAENDAVLFIKDKYGIDAEADYIKSYTFSDGDKLTTVKMTADGKDFTVELLTNENALAKFADDYQLDEIKQAVFDEVSRVHPNGTLRDVGIYSSDFLGDRVIERYFDGTNLDEVMERQHGGVTVDFADTKFDLESPLFKKLDEWSIKPYFTSFDTTDHRDEFVASEKFGSVYDYDEHYAKYAHYITDRVAYEWSKAGEKGKVIHKDYEIKTNGEFDYIFRDIAENENGTENIEQFFAKYNESEKVSKPISKAYTRESYGSDFYYVYYPLEKLNGVPAENIGAAWLDNSTGVSNNRGVERASICGDYAVFALPYHADEFMIVDTTDTGGTDKEI